MKRFFELIVEIFRGLMNAPKDAAKYIGSREQMVDKLLEGLKDDIDNKNKEVMK